jgi:predicted aminopeptidase
LKRGRIILYTCLIGVALVIVFNHQLMYYAYVQAKGQLNIIWHSEPVEEILKDPGFPDSMKIKLELIEEVKYFAVYDLGLKGIRNYTTYYDQKGEELMWVLSACLPFKLESYSWGFPILGRFTYKGFFRYDMALNEMEKLQKEGLDASIRTAGGWSTLGILRDPVLSNMLEGNTSALADLIIHELTHGTIFIKDSIEFNENLASFIGNAGARLFLRAKFGNSSPELDTYNEKLEDHKKFTRYVLYGAARLDSVYDSFTEEMLFEDKLHKKQAAISEFMTGIQRLSFHNEEYQLYFDDFTPDNTFFMSFLRYRGGQEVFENTLQREYNGDLPAYIEALKLEYGR